MLVEPYSHENLHTFVKKWNDTTVQLQLPSNLREPGDWYNRTIWSIFCKHSSCCTRGGQINDSCSPDSIRSLNSWNCCSLSGIHSKIIQLMRFKEIFKEPFIPKQVIYQGVCIDHFDPYAVLDRRPKYTAVAEDFRSSATATVAEVWGNS